MHIEALSALFLGLLVQAAGAPAKLPAVEAKKLRSQLADVLAEPEGAARTKFIANGKRLQEKYALPELVAALREGPVLPKDALQPRKVGKKQEKLTRFGNVTVGFTFEVDGALYRYAVDVPSSYDPERATPLFVDPGHGSGADDDDEGKAGFLAFYRGQADRAGAEGWLLARTEILEQIGAGGIKDSKPEDEVARVFQAFFRDVASRFRIDLDRVYVGGLSQTGFWAWYLGRARADRLAGIAPMSAVTWQVDAYLDCFRNLPTYVLHGEQDPICKVEQPHRTCAELEKLGFPVKYEEIAGAAHDIATWGGLHRALSWLKERPRNPYPKHVSKSLETLSDPWCYWICVEDLAQQGDGKAAGPPTAQIEGEIEGQTVRIRSSGVKRAKLCFSGELVDLDRPVEVWWNKKKVHEAKLERSFATAIEIACDKTDWRGTFEAAVSLREP